jgi:hypothetical protein
MGLIPISKENKDILIPEYCYVKRKNIYIKMVHPENKHIDYDRLIDAGYRVVFHPYKDIHDLHIAFGKGYELVTSREKYYASIAMHDEVKDELSVKFSGDTAFSVEQLRAIVDVVEREVKILEETAREIEAHWEKHDDSKSS